MEDDSITEEQIYEILSKSPIDYVELMKISRLNHGYINNKIRKVVWPKLLGIDTSNLTNFYSQVRSNHRDQHQVICDIDRSLWSLDKTLNWTILNRDRRRDALFNIILAILSRNPKLFYYQGYHDIIGIFLIVLEDDFLTFSVAEKITLKFLSDNMTEDFSVISRVIMLIFDIVSFEDKELHKFFLDCGLEPYFAMSWFITWFSHDIKEINLIARVFDVLICSHPIFSIYLSTAVN